MRTVTVRITAKGQVTIPLEVRRELGLEPGDRVVFVRENGNVRIRRAETTYAAETAGMFRGRGPDEPPTERALRDAAADGWAEDAMKDGE